MRFRLFIWLLLFILGAFVGDRYGLPGWARSIGDTGFTAVESWFGRLGAPIPEADETDNADDYALDDLDEPTGRDAPNSSYADDSSAKMAPTYAPTSDDLGNAANAGLRMNDAGLKIIEESEGLRLEAYNLGGQWLIGYGHAATAKQGMTITEAEAEQLLRQDVRASEDAVKRMVLVPLNENQFSALVSLAYNMGSNGFSRTTVLDALNKGNYKQAADNFRNHNKGGGKVIPHLTERREKERTLFLKPG